MAVGLQNAEDENYAMDPVRRAAIDRNTAEALCPRLKGTGG
jgi:hypothetical protein